MEILGIGSRINHKEHGKGVVTNVSTKHYWVTFMEKGLETIALNSDFEVIERLEADVDTVSFFDIERSLTKILEKIKPDHNIHLIVCFNKLDPELADDSEIEANIVELKKKIRERVEKLNLDLSFFKTTIYEQSTVLRMFSESIVKKTSKARLIQKHLNNFGRTTFSSATLLMDKNCLIVGSQYSNEKYKEVCTSIASWVTLALERIKKYDIFFSNLNGNISFNVNFNGKDNENKEMKSAKIFVEKFFIDNKWEFFIVSLTMNKRTSSLIEKYIPELADQLSVLL